MTSFTTYGATDEDGPSHQQSRQTDISELERHRCSDHLKQSRLSAAGSGIDVRSDMMHSTPIQHEPHCPRGDDDKKGNVCGSSAVATAREGDGKNYRALCHCEAACKCQNRSLWLTTSPLIPTNWPHWPILKKLFVGAAIAAPCIWLVIYLVLHFYYGGDF